MNNWDTQALWASSCVFFSFLLASKIFFSSGFLCWPLIIILISLIKSMGLFLFTDSDRSHRSLSFKRTTWPLIACRADAGPSLQTFHCLIPGNFKQWSVLQICIKQIVILLSLWHTLIPRLFLCLRYHTFYFLLVHNQLLACNFLCLLKITWHKGIVTKSRIAVFFT